MRVGCKLPSALALALLVLSSVNAAGGVGPQSVAATGSPTQYTVPMGSATTAGDALFCGVYSLGQAILTPSDSLGSTWSLVESLSVASASGESTVYGAVFSASAASSSDSGDHVFISLAAPTTSHSWCYEFANASTSLAANATGSGLIPLSTVLYNPAVPPTDVSNELAISFAFIAGCGSGPGSTRPTDFSTSYNPPPDQFGFNTSCGSGTNIQDHTTIASAFNIFGASSSTTARWTITATPSFQETADRWGNMLVAFAATGGQTAFVQRERASVSVVQPLEINLGNPGSPPAGTFTLSNGEVTGGGGIQAESLPSDGSSHSFLVQAGGVTINETGPSNSTARYLFPGGMSTHAVTTCALSLPGTTCPIDSATVYFELRNAWQITPSTPTAWDSGRSIRLMCAIDGTVQAGEIFTPIAGEGALASTLWTDYGQACSFEPSTGGVGAWFPDPTMSPIVTTSGNTFGSDYVLNTQYTTSTTTSSATVTSTTASSRTTTSGTTSGGGGGGGIPEYPYQLGPVALLTLLVVSSYLLARRRSFPGGPAGSVARWLRDAGTGFPKDK